MHDWQTLVGDMRRGDRRGTKADCRFVELVRRDFVGVLLKEREPAPSYAATFGYEAELIYDLPVGAPLRPRVERPGQPRYEIESIYDLLFATRVRMLLAGVDEELRGRKGKTRFLNMEAETQLVRLLFFIEIMRLDAALAEADRKSAWFARLAPKPGSAGEISRIALRQIHQYVLESRVEALRQ